MSSRWLACLPGLDVRGSKHSWRCTAWPFRRGRSSDDTPLRDQSRLERHTIQRNILATSVVAAHCATPLLLRQVIYCGICGNFQKPLAEMVISEAGPHLFLELDCSQLLYGFPDPDRFDLLPMESSASYTSSPCAECVSYVPAAAYRGMRYHGPRCMARGYRRNSRSGR